MWGYVVSSLAPSLSGATTLNDESNISVGGGTETSKADANGSKSEESSGVLKDELEVCLKLP